LRNLGLDINAGLSASRYGQINGVSVGNVVTPFASMGVSLPANLGVEAFGCLPVPTGGNLTDPSTTGVPLALRLGFGIGYQFAMGDYALGIEGGLLSEWGNVGLPDTSSRFVNYSPWLNIAFGARNRNVSFGEPFR
jgi:hypothetical protein